jgi:thiol-disulfide isomerase/thioredoxin
MQKIYFLFSFLIVLTNNYHATTIEVIAPDYKNKKIKWEKRTDYISNIFSIIDQADIDSSGKAILIGDFKQIELTEISIGRSHGFIYIDTATKNYKVYFPKDTLLDIASLKKSQIQLLFINLPEEDINQLVLDFNLYYDYFLYGDTSKIVRMAKHDEEFQDSLNNFKIFSSKRYGPIKIKYLHNYIRYEIALLEQMAHQSKGDVYRSYLFNSYLKRNGINYNNDAYMQFFNLFYFKPFRIGGDQLYERVLFTINELNDYEKLNNILASNQYFSNEQLRELAIIKGLFDGINSKEFSNESIINLLVHITKNSKWDQHQLIANRCINELLKFKVGEKSPDFNLKNQNGENINLSSCKNKYTYINFFATWNHRSLQEMEIINQMSIKYDFINFVSVNMDINYENYKIYLAENNGFNWQICNAINQEEIIKHFNLDHLPTYLLIDQNGNIAQYPAYPPSPLYNSQSIDITFFNINKNNTTKTPFGIGGKN